jgi:hypothetical protein
MRLTYSSGIVEKGRGDLERVHGSRAYVLVGEILSWDLQDDGPIMSPNLALGIPKGLCGGQ